MKKLLFPLTSILLSVMLFCLMPTEAEAKIYEDTTRLHILANSDDARDQEIKLAVRDALLLTYGEELSECADADRDAFFGNRLDEIRDFVNAELASLGAPYSCEVSYGKEWYDTRVYDQFTLPKGVYTSLQIKLGCAEGRNWWCVMYPPLCLDLATDAPRDDALLGYNTQEQSLIQNGRYQVKFKALELLSSVFKK